MNVLSVLIHVCTTLTASVVNCCEGPKKDKDSQLMDDSDIKFIVIINSL